MINNYQWYMQYNVQSNIPQTILPDLSKNYICIFDNNYILYYIAEPLCSYIFIQVIFVNIENKLTIKVMIKNMFDRTYIFRTLDTNTNIDEAYGKHYILNIESQDSLPSIFSISPFDLEGSGWTQKADDGAIVIHIKDKTNE